MAGHAGVAELIRGRMRVGELPVSADGRAFGGQGEGQLCACCDLTIAPSELQFELECQMGGARRTLEMHLRCFNVWMEECRAYRAEQAARLQSLSSEP